MQRKLEQPKMMADFMAGARYLKAHPETTGRIGATGFCFGGGIVNNLAVQLGPDLRGERPVLRRPAAGRRRAEDQGCDADPLRADDERINAGWPAYEAALKANRIPYEAFIYPGTQHGFHNDTTPRFNPEAAKLSWQRTLDHFNKN